MMKKLLLILTTVFIYSCTYKSWVSTDVSCPCVITSIRKTPVLEHRPTTYRVRIESVESPAYYIEFNTNYLYNIGDTIK